MLYNPYKEIYIFEVKMLMKLTKEILIQINEETL